MTLEDLKTALADYEDILTFEEVGEVVKVTMQYQRGPHGKVKWSAVNSIVKEFGGEWISLGRDSHFKVPRQQASSETPIEHRWANALEVAVGEIERIIADLRKVKA